METWEYTWMFIPTSKDGMKTITMDMASEEGIKNLNSSLERFGNDGWELVSIVPFERSIGISPSYYGGVGGGGGTGLTMWVFKRRKKQSKSE